MFKRNQTRRAGDDNERPTYALNWPSSDRWNPNYNVPRNSFATENGIEIDDSQLEKGNNTPVQRVKHSTTTRSLSWGVKRDLDTSARGRAHLGDEDDLEEEFSNLTHWLHLLAELYMNELDNRARWDTRWLNITRRERFEGLSSVEVTVIDYLEDNTVKTSERIKGKNELASTLQDRPKDSTVRVIMVNDISRFIMGALGQMYSIDPEFWFEHLISSGYGASDSGLKLKNAVWMNWAERETRFRHHALPKIGQRTEWNAPRRTKVRKWAHLRWGRLGLLNYLGRKGFHEDEMGQRISDGRWMIERDVRLDKRGFFMTAKRQAQAAKKARKEDRKGKAADVDTAADGSTGRSKASNVYRPYSSFVPLPRNPGYWLNRDLRVLSPEGVSYYSTEESDGRKTIIILLDPIRNMRHEETKEMTPSLTFMPRAMEFESFSNEELWRIAEPGETYLDPPPPPISNKELKQQKRAARRQYFKEKKGSLQEKLDKIKGVEEEEEHDCDIESAYTSDSEYDEEYENNLRQGYNNPTQFTRDRDYARKYAMSTSTLITRYLSKITTSDLLEDNSIIPSLLTRVSLDDFWQLLAELRLSLDQIDGDLGADLHLRLLESVGTSIRQTVGWMRSTLQELREWTAHLDSTASVLGRPPELTEELGDLVADLQDLHARTEQTLNLLVAATGLAQSTLVVDQTSGINKLTELAFFFIPLSFITSVFSMQVSELTETPPRLWTWGLSLAIVFLVTYFIRTVMRSPTIRLFAMHCRVTMLNRFTPSGSRNSSKRLNAIGNRTIAKFLFFLISVTSALIAIVAFFLFGLFLVFGGLWLGAAATAIYFIVTRWGDLAVVIPCFICIAVAAVGLYASWSWLDEIGDVLVNWTFKTAEALKDMFPAKWTLDSVDDEDLAKEGIETFGRQAIVLSST